MRKIAIGMIAAALGGCAASDTIQTGPNGLPIHHIVALTSASMWDEAGRLCTNGYKMIMEPRETNGGGNWEMAIECK